MAVDGKSMSNVLETAVRTAPVHRYSSGIIVNTDNLMTFVPIYSILFGVRKI